MDFTYPDGGYSRDENYLRVFLYFEESDLILKVMNPVDEKKESEESGFGSELINSLAESLGGTLSFTQKEGQFIVECRITGNT